ncbi:MAG: four-carbon acid sugar kinase family protein [Suipraeoptans sp.]
MIRDTDCLGKEWTDVYIDSELNNYINKNAAKIIVLDDDPTGVQTVHNINVYTDWEIESIKRGFKEENKLFYILTNSRGFTVSETTACHKQIISRIELVSKELNTDYIIISRSDSTLRGHYPLETNLLREGMEKHGGKHINAEILCPFFKEGGRFTIDNIHYVKQDDKLIPAAETEFAKDATFGYKSSDLTKYVEEKTNGEFKASDVTTIAIADLRNKNIDGILQQLLQVDNYNKVVVNATSYSELKVFMIALYKALETGKRFTYRVAAGFVKVIGGISDKPLLKRDELIVSNNSNGGIVVVGSHTKKTSSQLEQLKTLEGIKFIEMNSDMVLVEGGLEREVERVVGIEEEEIVRGTTVVVYTKRKLLTLDNDTKEDALIRSVKISAAVCDLVGKLSVTPSFIVAKGGITSSDIGTKGLAVKRANVIGQIKPAIPVWQTGSESRFPMIPYIIFPGNVGDIQTLKEVVEILKS